MYDYSFILLQEKNNKTFFKNTVTIIKREELFSLYQVNPPAFLCRETVLFGFLALPYVKIYEDLINAYMPSD